MDTTRRHFLRGAAAASALASVPVAAASTPMAENPELIGLGDEFDTAYALLVDAAVRVAELTPTFRAIAPAIPSEISGEEHSRFPGWRYAEFYRDPASPKGEDMRGVSGRRVMVVPSYRLDRIGMASAIAAHHDAEGRLRRVVYSMANVRARTPVGLAIKIRATGAYAGLGSEERFSASLWLANAMWADLEEGV